ncbi:MAG TPA: S49 family peptidase [Caulobacteraceae bacterium]|nr:S49 family peptidase [Caulobacteraceae bacterium]
MKQFLLTVAGVLVGLVVFTVALPFALMGLAASLTRPAPVAAHTVLDLDLRGPLTDQTPQGGLALFSGGALSVVGVEQAIDAAAADPRIGGLFVRLPDAGMAPAAADELRGAFLRFRAAGKPILAYSQGFYPQGVSTATYELGAASGDLWMQPSASFQTTGIAAEDVFLKKFFDRYGVVADYQQRYQYKTAVNPYLYDDYTPAQRQSELSWMGSVFDTSLAAAAADRRLQPAVLEAAIEAGPYSAQDARAKGLIDRTGEVKQAQDAILAAAGAGAKLAPFTGYLARARARGAGASGPQIALIQAEGDIVTGTGAHQSLVAGGQNIYSDDLSRAFYAAIADPQVKAIVFRLSSPGGVDTASEQIAAAVRAAKAAGKPVVVSMGEYGASGGYWICAGASQIIAEPSTLTGSIGVFGGKFALGPALARFGVDMRGLSVGGAYSSAFGAAQAMTPAQSAAFGAWLDRIYASFVGRVAAGRHLPVQQVEAIAKGRVWTGVQAKSLGLVDALGGLPLAIDRAKALAGLSGPVRLKPFGVSTSPFAALARLFGAGAGGVRLMAAAADLARDPDSRALIGTLHDARLREAGATVLAPEVLGQGG